MGYILMEKLMVGGHHVTQFDKHNFKSKGKVDHVSAVKHHH